MLPDTGRNRRIVKAWRRFVRIRRVFLFTMSTIVDAKGPIRSTGIL